MKQEEKLKALDAALVKIEKDYGKGSVMKLEIIRQIVQLKLHQQDRSVLILH